MAFREKERVCNYNVNHIWLVFAAVGYIQLYAFGLVFQRAYFFQFSAIGINVMNNPPPKRRPVLIWLIISQVLALLSLFFWLLMAGLSVMAFDSGSTPEAWTFVIAVWSYPIWPIGFAIAAWVAYARKKDRLAGILTMFTFLPVLILLAVIVIGNLMFFLTYPKMGLP